MNTVTTTNVIESSNTNEGLEYEPDGLIGFTSPPFEKPTGSLLHTAIVQDTVSDETGCPNRDDCTYETDETKETGEREEAEETQEPEDLEEREELATPNSTLWSRIDEAISECGVSANRNVNRPLFLFAHKIRTTEEELNVRFPLDVIAEFIRRWREQNYDHLENDHDYLAEFLDKLSLVRHPRGRVLARAVEIARGRVPPRQTTLLSPDVQLLASLCEVLQQQAGNKPFFLDGRSAAKALGKPHETVASWLRALCQLPLIKRVRKGTRGMASRYKYIDQSRVDHKNEINQPHAES
jgi:hypothetical protein